MDRPLEKLAQACGFRTTDVHEWPAHVDEDLAEFAASTESRALFVVEQEDGLIIGPPPRSADTDLRALAVVKTAGVLPTDNWYQHVVVTGLPLSSPQDNQSSEQHNAYAALHALMAQALIPLFDSQGGGGTARSRLVEAERALAQLRHTQVAFVELEGTAGDNDGSTPAAAQVALDSDDVNTLHQMCNNWKQQVSQLAASDRDVRRGSASEEIVFWTELERALRSAEQQLGKQLVRQVMQRLEQSKRFHATHNFVGDTGLTEAITRVQGYTQLLFKDLPLGELLAAGSPEQLIEATDAVFAHVQRKLRASGYPAQRSVAFAEALGRDFATTLTRITTQQLEGIIDEEEWLDTGGLGGNMQHLASRVQVLARGVLDAAEAWDEQVRDFSTFIRDLIRRRGEKLVVVRITSSHEALAMRMQALATLCAKHAELRPLVESATVSNDELAPALDAAFAKVLQRRLVLQTDATGWQRLEHQYARAAHGAEVAVAEDLRIKLSAAAQNDERELLAVFKRHAAVLARPQVRVVAHAFQTPVLERARNDLAAAVKAVHSDFQKETVVQRVVRKRQLRVRMAEIRQRLECVLGADWREHSEGAQIGGDCSALERELDTNDEVAKWEQQLSGAPDVPVFGGSNAESEKCVLGVLLNYYEDTETAVDSLSTLRSLRALGHRFSPQTSQAAELRAETDSAALRLGDALAVLTVVCSAMVEWPRIRFAADVAEHARRILAFVRTGLRDVKWVSTAELPSFVGGFEKAVALLDVRVTQLAVADAEISELLANPKLLTSSDGMAEEMAAALMSPSALMSPAYAAAVRRDLALVMERQLAKSLEVWEPKPSKHRIDVHTRAKFSVSVTPPLDVATWFSDLNSLLGTAFACDAEACRRAMHSLQVIEAYGAALLRARKAWRLANLQIQQWQDWQPLWTANTSTLPTENEVSGMLAELCDAQDRVVEGPLVLDTAEANAVVDAKCRYWQSILTARLAQWVTKQSHNMVERSRATRQELEGASLDLAGLLRSLTAFGTGKRLVAEFMITLADLLKNDLLLKRCQFQLPVDWVSSDMVKAEVAALSDITAGCVSRLEEARPQLLRELEQRVASNAAEVAKFSIRWHAERPLQAQIEPPAALARLISMKADLDTLQEATNTTEEAYTSLDTTSSRKLLEMVAELKSYHSELSELELAWSDLHNAWNQVAELGKNQFSKAKIKQLHTLRTLVEGLPERTQRLPNYTRLQSMINDIIQHIPQLSLLQSSTAIQNRHIIELVPSFPESRTLLLSDVWTHLPALELVSVVVERAEGEHTLLRYVEAVQTKWDNMFLECKDGTVRNLNVLLTLAADHLAAFGAMRSSPHFEAVSVVVNELERRLGEANQQLDLFVNAQQQFLYLRGVLTSASVATLLPGESRRFQGVAEEFAEVYSNAQGKRALEFAVLPRLAGNLTRILGQFASLHRGLAGFMETQRRRFPRLLFVGDDDLLEIVGNPIEQWGFKHLPSLFPNVAHLADDGSHVLSAEGERLDIAMDPKFSDNVEMLVKLEEQIRSSLKRIVFKAIDELKAVNNSKLFGIWLENTPLQAVLVALREQWSRNGYTSDSDSLNSNMQWLASAGDDSPLWTRRRECIVAELIHQSENEPNELLISVKVADGSKLMVNCGPCSAEYGFEFIKIEPVVRTKVTDDLFLCGSAAIARHQGGSIIGPAGTGKTESVKALGALFGRNVVVFNCDDAFDFNSMKRAMAGCGVTQSWACFDEFNRLSRRVLSAVAQTVSKSVKQTPVFVTMNPGYVGRTVLPPNMRDEFREFVLAAPDARKISQVLLYAHGKVGSSEADGVVQLLETMESLASKQKHYDWGLRALKGVLGVCRQLNGDVRKACEIAIRPRLISSDLQIFDTEITKVPAASELTVVPSCRNTMFDAVSEDIRPFVESLHTFSQLFAGVMLLGDAGSGKTRIWQEYAKTVSAETVVIDPSAVPKSALLGRLDTLTREWTDGVLSALLRNVNNNLRGERSKTWIVVFSGEVEPEWAEALNSVLDDNRQLTLASGEILTLPNNVHIVFETTNLKAATPATVSRCGMICLPSPKPTSSFIPAGVIEAASKCRHAMEFMICQAELTASSLKLGSPWLSMAWAFAGDSDETGRIEVSNAIRKAAPITDNLPTGNLLQYYVSDLTGRWHSWQDCVEVVTLEPSAVERPDVVVPTVDTAAHRSLLQAALASRRPLLLVGPPGSGKTMTLFNALRHIPQIVLIALNFSSSATPQLVIQALEMHCEYSLGSDGSRILSPPGSRWAALFIDEINLPQPNNNEVVAVIQVLRFMVEFCGFHNSNGEFIKLERIQLVGACNPPPQRRPLPASFLRHLVVINVQHPSNVALKTIYSTFMSTFDAQSLVDPMITAYEQLIRERPGEIWTPRELTRWMRGIYAGYNNTAESRRSQSLLNQLMVYEGCRVLGDRLDAQGQREVRDMLLQLTGVANTSKTNNSAWSYYLSKRPTFVSFEELASFMTARLPVFVEEAAAEGDCSLVMHDDFVRLVTRVDRVIRHHQGHALVVGPASVGKTSAIRFACWAIGLELRLLRTNSKYSDADFVQDLRNALLAALRRPLCLQMGQSLLQTPEFVERMNSLLANGEVPGLFTAENATELEESCRRAGFTGGDLNPWFRQTVVANLHIVFTTNDLSQVSPALLNRCNVIRVFDWSPSVKRKIAANWCRSIDVGENVVQCLTSLPYRNGRQFLECCIQFVSVYKQRKSNLEDTQRHFVTGGNRLKEALLEVGQLKTQLATQQKQLEHEDTRSRTVLAKMLTEQSEAERKRAAAVEIRMAVQQQTLQIEERRKAAHEDLAATEPFIQQAAQGVQNIKKAQLNELRALTNPPEPVKITLEAVCLLLGLQTDGSWKQVLTAVRGDEFIPRIVHFDSNVLMSGPGAHLISKIEKDYMSLPSFTYERVDRASKASGPLLRWVVAQVAYARTLLAVQPLMNQIEELNRKSLQSQAQLDAIEAMLSDLEVAIESSKVEYSKAVAQCEVLKADMHRVQQQLKRAEQLLASLSVEQTRWSDGAKQFPEHMAMLPGRSLMESSQIALAGPLDITEQKQLAEEVTNLGISNDLQMDPTLTLRDSLISREEIAQRSHSVALVIDPSNSWKAEDINSNVMVTSFLFDTDSLIKELDTALRFGQHLVIQHAERFDPLLTPLLNREFVRKGARLLVNLGNGDIDVAPGFKLTLHARDLAGVTRNAHMLLSHTSVVDFRMTPGKFERMVGDALLNAQLPELAQRRRELLEVRNQTGKKLRRLEEELLSALSSLSESTSLLVNQQLVQSLETLKAESCQLEQVQKSTAATLEELNKAYASFDSDARSASEVYIKARSLESVDPFYVIGVDWLWQVAQMVIDSKPANFPSKFCFEVNNRIAAVVRSEHRPTAVTNELKLAELVEEAPPITPIIAGMTSPNVADPAYALARSNPNSHIIAMGSSQSAAKAEALIDQAIELGEWVIVQNSDIADETWLKRLARRLQGAGSNVSGISPNFRLILTGLQNGLLEIPDLISSGRAVTIERTHGIKNILQHSLDEVIVAPIEPLSFSVCWIHACFTEAFFAANFSEQDLETALWLLRQLESKLNAAELWNALLTVVWQAKIGTAKAKISMQDFVLQTSAGKSLPNTAFEKWIDQLPEETEWLPKTLII